MKIKCTKKQIRNNFVNVISLGYCSVQSLLHFSKPFAYSAGINGWACDYYQFGNICISTGYAPVGNISPKYDLIKEYESKAEKIINNYNLTNLEKTNQIDYLLNEFINISVNKLNAI